ncbi:MAG: hypothetical protein CL908_07990 [Deltaproteobacteria bacterium]|nr:hypothetical protein [Deltaproteobacteria bacterium]
MRARGVGQSIPVRAEIAGSSFAWLDEPSRAEPGGPYADAPPLALVHGFTGHRDDFLGAAQELAARRRVIVPDLRGHGDSDESPGPYGFSFEQLVKDLLTLLDHLGIERCDLLGHSFGGMVVLRFALAHIERVRSLIFLCTSPELPAGLPSEGFDKAAEIAEAHGIGRLQALAERAARPVVSAQIAKWGERYWAHHRRRLGSMTPESYRGIGSAMFEGRSLVERLPEIDCPTLVIVGEMDLDWLPGADLFEQNLPRVERITLAGAEHHPHQENPAAWHAAIEAHLDRVAREGA